MNTWIHATDPPRHHAGWRVASQRRRSLLTPMLLVGVVASVGLRREQAPSEPQDPSLPAHARSLVETHGAMVSSLAFAAEGDRLYWADSMHDRVGTWSPSAGSAHLQHQDAVLGHGAATMVLDPTGRTIAATYDPGGIVLWDAHHWLREGRWLDQAPRQVRKLAFTLDGSTLIGGCWDGSVRL